MDIVRFVDTTLRDGQQSLWAMGMRTEMMLPVAHSIDKAGFEAVEIVSAAFFKKCIRELKDAPLRRVRLIADAITTTPLRAIRSRQIAAFHMTPDSISDLWLERVAANGVKQIRLSDPSNTSSSWEKIMRSADRVGLDTIINLIFSISPKHTDDYYRAKARAAAKLGPFRICLKDPSGLLTPERTQTLVPAILENVGSIPVELHTHCTTGLGPLCCVEAIRLGIRSINTAIPPLANGTANSSVFNVAMNARALGFTSALDEELLKPVQDHFTRIAKLDGFPMGLPLEYNSYHYIHQVPGGMISNFRHQLSIVGMERRMSEILEEVGRVRAEFGYPIMVTPYSQFVGVQAAMNVILGERYKEVTDEVIQYAQGIWGEEESDSMDPDIKDRILSRSRAKELANTQHSGYSIEELRQKLGGCGVSDDELLLRYFVGVDDVDIMRRAGSPKEYVSVSHPLARLVEELAKRKNCRQIFIQQKHSTIRLAKTGAI